MAAQTMEDETNSIAPKELKELKRVYEKLCLWSEKFKIIERLNTIEDDVLNLHDSSLNNDKDSKSNELEQLSNTKRQLNEELEQIRNRPDQHIRVQDAAAAFKSLGKKVPKREILDMMWEVDEKLDNIIDWDEFSLMFARNIHDSTGLEPAGFYHMVQFMIYDRNDNGKVSVDETMNMLYARVGREKMETIIIKLFGDSDGSAFKEEGSQGGEIDFNRYWDVVEREQINRFEESELGKTLLEKKRKK